jgi:thiamine monophosphate synthase
MRAGADGIAVVSAICGKLDAARATRELADIVNFRDRPQALS